METIQGNLYDFPRYYDLVFGSDWKAEFDFLEQCFERHAGRQVRDIFEPACGTGRLIFRLAKAGYRVAGLDLNSMAIDYCNDRLARHGFARTALVGDMTDFCLARSVDAAFNMINSFRHLLTERQAAGHLKCVANVLRSGGVYILGLHLTPTTVEPMEQESWSARRGSLCVNTRLWTTDRDLAERREQFSMSYDVYTPTRSFRIEDVVEFRTYTASQITKLIERVDDLEVLGIYDFAYDIDRPIRLTSDAEDVVFVLRKH